MDFITEYNNLFRGLTSNPSVGELGSSSAEKLLYYSKLVNPKIVVEIGFNRGSSALTFLLSNNDCVVYSIDIREYNVVKESVQFLKKTFPNRFEYIESSSEHLLTVLPENINPDLVFIDGDHSYDGIYRDAKLSKQLNPRCIIFDDACHEFHGKDVMDVIQKMGWEDSVTIDCETSIFGTEASSGFAIINIG